MKIKQLIYIFSTFLLLSCSRMVKNPDAKVEDEIASTNKEQVEKPTQDSSNKILVSEQSDLLGFWVGYFEKDEKNTEPNYIEAGDVFYWGRENKINISIDQISEGKVLGHSVVAGNDRPFEGTVKEEPRHFVFDVAEPGDDKYDGKFSFTITKNDSLLRGTWKAYKKIAIPERQYVLTKKIYQYNANQNLEENRAFTDWEKTKKRKVTYQIDEEYETYDELEYSTATDAIYKLNASSQLLTKTDTENLKKGDLKIIRNTIYARHGYSFKNRPLRVFFDAQPWYIPVHTDIKSELTSIEKQNIKLLLRYEKNAEEYYDSFGR